jgi:hypothetical protein
MPRAAAAVPGDTAAGPTTYCTTTVAVMLEWMAQW